MRRRITSKEIRYRFRTAWNYLPTSVKKDLRSFIRYIDEVPELFGTYIYAKASLSGPVEIVEGPLAKGTGYTFYCSFDTREFCDVILPNDPLATFPEGYTLAIILHELAHAYEYYVHRRAACNNDEYSAETYAWHKAIEWAEQAEPDTNLFMDIKRYANTAVLYNTEKELHAMLIKLLEQ